MKTFFLILILIFLLGCVGQSAADKSQNISFTQTPIANQTVDANANKFTVVQDVKPDVDEATRKEIEVRNAQFEIVPDEWKKVDFENFKFPLTTLKNGENDERGKKYAGGRSFSLSEVYYVDLTGDEKKEAVVFLYTLSCGGSCDGGRETIYFHKSSKGKAKLLDEIVTGSKSSSCSLKSFKVQNKKIILEQFGRCKTNTDYEENTRYSCKFCVKDMTRSVYSFDNSELIRKSSDVFETSEVNVMSYLYEVSIND